MTPFSMFLALQPQLQGTWSLSNTESGWISSAYFAGYMLAVPVLSSLTDRVDARAVWLAACGMTAAGAIGFALWANGVWSAAIFQMVAGAGLAGTYMPGLKVIADRLPHVPRPRHVAFYTTSFTAGSSLSFWIVGVLGSGASWRTVVLLTALGPVAAWLLVALRLRPVPIVHEAHAAPAVHWRAVFGSADTMRYVIGYSAHTWELFALRAWIVPFVTYCISSRTSQPPLTAATIAALVAMIGIPASIAGAELTARVERRRLIVTVMLCSVAASLLVLPLGVRLVGARDCGGRGAQRVHQRRFRGPDVRHPARLAGGEPGHGDGGVFDAGFRGGVCRHVRGGRAARPDGRAVGDELGVRVRVDERTEPGGRVGDRARV